MSEERDPTDSLLSLPLASLDLALTRIFERNGDKVIQFALIDHFPTTFLAPALGVDVTKTPLRHACARKEFIDASFDNLVAMTRRDGGGNVPRRIASLMGFLTLVKGCRPHPSFSRTRTY